MNICFVPPVIAGTVSGGVNTQIRKTAEALERANHKITFLINGKNMIGINLT